MIAKIVMGMAVVMGNGLRRPTRERGMAISGGGGPRGGGTTMVVSMVAVGDN